MIPLLLRILIITIVAFWCSVFFAAVAMLAYVYYMIARQL